MRHGTAVLVLSLAALALAAGPANAHRGGFGRGIFPMPRFVNSFSNLLSTVDSACVAALNETFAVSAACRPANLTRGISKDTFCSGACGTAVDTYWTNAVSVCGTQVLLQANGTDITATDMEANSALERALECIKDLSGTYCKLRMGHRGGKYKRHRGGMGGGEGMRGGREGGRGGGFGGEGGYNATSCAECTKAALTAIAPLSAEYPDAKWFAGHFNQARSWDEVQTDIATRCDTIASKISSRGIRPTMKAKSGGRFRSGGKSFVGGY